MTEEMNVTDVLDHIDDKSKSKKITLREILGSFGHRGYGPILLALALIEILPTGAIPGVPTVLAILIIMIAGQLVVGRSSPWVPKKLQDKGVDRKKFEEARDKLRPYAQKMDKFIKPRMQNLTTSIAARLVGLVCILLAMTMPPLEVIPFASSIPSSAIALFGIGLSAHDGLIIVLGLIAAFGAGYGVVYWLIL